MVATNNVRRIRGARPDDLREWLDLGRQLGATHMMVVCGTETFEDSPVYIMPGEPPQAKIDLYARHASCEVCEVYKLDLDWELQIRAWHVWNI